MSQRLTPAEQEYLNRRPDGIHLKMRENSQFKMREGLAAVEKTGYNSSFAVMEAPEQCGHVVQALRESRPLIIVDIDGTLGDNRQRRDLVPREDKENPAAWSAFNMARAGDTPIAENIAMVKKMIAGGMFPIYVSSCGADAKALVEDQLRSYGLQPFPLVLRPMDERRKPALWKVAVVQSIESYYGYPVTLAIDDDPAVCNALRENGITVIQIESTEQSVIGNY